MKLDDGQRLLLFWRAPKASFYASSSAWRLDPDLASSDVVTLLRMAHAGDPGFEPLIDGFDTYWYTWATVHRDTRLVAP